MPTLARTCSECPNTLAGKPPQTKTCGDACRLKRSRRIRRANQEVEEFAERNNAGAAEIAAIVRREAPDVVTKVMREQLQPIVREALTEDVLRAVSDMVGLTPAAVAALNEDLESEDATVRQRAYSLVIKYTVGHPALVKPIDAEHGQLVVNFNLPRPEGGGSEEHTDAELPEIQELRVCDRCGEEKDADELVAGSSRCLSCFAADKARILEQFGS